MNKIGRTWIVLLCTLTFYVHAGALTQTPFTKVEEQYDEPPNISVHLEYPQISGNKDIPAEKFNALVHEIINIEQVQFQDLVKTTHAEGKSTLALTYNLFLQQAKKYPIASVLFTINSYVAGGAYPNVSHKIFNFDLNTGNPLTLAELFKVNSHYLERIKKYCIDALSKKLDQNAKEIESQLSFNNWNVSPQGLVFTFDDFPHALGTQTVIIPYAYLKNIISPTSPIYVCAATSSERTASPLCK